MSECHIVGNLMHWLNYIFPLIEAFLRRGFLNVETYSTVQNFDFRHYKYQHTMGLCQFIAYCVVEFETVFRGIIFWRLLCYRQ